VTAADIGAAAAGLINFGTPKAIASQLQNADAVGRFGLGILTGFRTASDAFLGAGITLNDKNATAFQLGLDAVTFELAKAIKIGGQNLVGQSLPNGRSLVINSKALAALGAKNVASAESITRRIFGSLGDTLRSISIANGFQLDTSEGRNALINFLNADAQNRRLKDELSGLVSSFSAENQ